MAKILILSPYDMTDLSHGGKVDLQGLLNFVKELKHETFLIAIDRNIQFSSEGISAKRLSYARYLFSFSKYPYLAYSRKITKTQMHAIKVFDPDIVILITEFMIPSYLQLQYMEFKKVVLRRANNEFVYLQSLLSIRNPLLSIYRLNELLKMYYLQRNTMKAKIDLTLDIAKNELPAPGKIIVSGSLNSKQPGTHPSSGDEVYDFGYIGNLDLPNSRHGINWFVNSVVPKIQLDLPDARILIAGKSPSSSLIKKCQDQGILIIANPIDVTDLNKSIKVFVNPVFRGSGINMKLVTPINLKKPIASTTFGSRGFPEIVDFYGTGDEPDTFKDICLKLLSNYKETLVSAAQVYGAFEARMDKVNRLIKSELNVNQIQE